MIYTKMHSDSTRIENLFVDAFTRLGKDYTKYRTSGILNADSIQMLPITVISITLDWIIFEGGVSDDLKSRISDFRRENIGVETAGFNFL